MGTRWLGAIGGTKHAVRPAPNLGNVTRRGEPAPQVLGARGGRAHLPAIDQLLQAAVVAVMTVAAVALLVAHNGAPGHLLQTHKAHVTAIGSSGSNLLQLRDGSHPTSYVP